MSSSIEGLWNVIVGIVVEVERDEIARIIGSKRIQDNQVLWEEVKAYNDILSETHMLACDDLDERFKANTSSSANNHQNKAQAKTSAPNVAVPLLSLTTSDKNKHSASHSSNNKQQAKMVSNNRDSSGFLSSTTEHPQPPHHRDEAKKPSSNRQQPQQQHNALDSPGSRLTTARSTRRSISGSACGSSGYMLAHGDATEFVLSIQEYLTMDRIVTVLDDIKDAFDLEHQELLLKIKQLEQTMESDYCDVVSTNRSQHSGGAGMGTGTKATSTPRSNYRVDDFDPFDDRAMSKDSIQSRPLGGVGGNGVLLSVATILPPPTCSMCGGDVGDFLSASNGTSTVGMTMTPGDKSRDNHRDNSSSSSSNNDRRVPEALVCLDCRARSRREKKLLNRLPKQAASSSVSVGKNQEFKSDHAISSSLLSHGFLDSSESHHNNNNSQKESSSSLQQQNSKSTFRNRLQAARDEHHFIQDDYLP